MNALIVACVLAPLLGFWLIFFSGDHEHRIAAMSLWMSRIMGVLVLGLLAGWLGGFRFSQCRISMVCSLSAGRLSVSAVVLSG